MTPERWQRVKEIFDSVKGRDPERRAAFLDDACAGDREVRREVESLLVAHDRAPDFMDEPAISNTPAGRPGLSAGERLGPFEVVSLLGAGGMGEVYLAHDSRLGRRVALKLLPPYLTGDADRVRRFEREARAASGLNHPNILTIYEVGECDGRHYIVTEYVEGETLRDRLGRGGKLQAGEALDVAAQVAAALAAAHEAGVVHRDVKPENVMVRGDGLVKLLDFGLAKLAEGAQADSGDSRAPTRPLARTAPGVVMGTVRYMSPEQARGLELDARTDVWSLGVVLYEMLTGRAPFDGETTADVLISIIQAEPPPVPVAPPSASDEVNRVIGKSLRKDKKERHRSGGELLDELRALQSRLGPGADHGRPAPPRRRAHTGQTKRLITRTGRTAGLRQLLVSRVGIAALALLSSTAVAALVYFQAFRTAPPASPKPVIRSLAVLPLKSLDAGENYLGLGIADAVIRRISQTGELTVRPTSAVRRYVNEETDALTAARQLSADAVLEGSVQRADERLRVSVNLLRAADGASLWADSFDMRVADIFTIQDTISQQVASYLQLKLSASQQERLEKRHTSNPEAYEYFVKGRTNLERVSTSVGDLEPTETAVSYFKKAVVLDPKYALAYAALGQAYLWMANFNDPDNPTWVGLAQQALARAESLDPQLAEIHSARFQYYFSRYGGWDLARAAREARQALTLNPAVGHDGLGVIYDHLGLDETIGLRENQRVLEIDPTNTSAQARLIESYELYGKFDEAIDAQRRFFGTPGPPLSLMAKGRLDEARPLLEEAVKKNSGDLRARARLALLDALGGKFQEAEASLPPILEQARNNRAYHHITYDIARVYALEGGTGEAVKWLRTTAETGMPNYPLFVRDPFLNRIRQAPEVVRFMAELKTRWEGYRRECELLN